MKNKEMRRRKKKERLTRIMGQKRKVSEKEKRKKRKYILQVH